MPVSKRLRYEILRRDNHACRYCGAAAPDAKLTVDHVLPVTLGGSDDANNLVTACVDCNAGKSSTPPDAPLAAEVDRSAEQWASAIRTVAERRQAETVRRHEDTEAVAQAWETMRSHQFRSLDMPVDWRISVDQFLNAGLTRNDLINMIIVAHTTETASNKWKYFCGCCWTLVRQTHAAAAALISEAEGC